MKAGRFQGRVKLAPPPYLDAHLVEFLEDAHLPDDIHLTFDTGGFEVRRRRKRRAEDLRLLHRDAEL